MTNQIPVQSCETGKKCSSCSPCMKKMMFIIVALLIIIGGYFIYSKFFVYEKTSYDKNFSLSVNNQYQNYSSEKYNELLGKKPMVLFFHANWCPTCRNQEKLIKENLSLFKNDLNILRVNYDKETELKKKYAITMQSIVVVIDENGNEIGRVADFSSIEKLTAITSELAVISDVIKIEEVNTPSISGEMLPYSEAVLTKSLSENKTVILSFAADWCPSCRSLEKDIMANIKNIPSNTVLLRADFDKETALKQKYAITMQHTFVLVDKDMNMTKKWSGSPTLESLISEIK